MQKGKHHVNTVIVLQDKDSVRDGQKFGIRGTWINWSFLSTLRHLDLWLPNFESWVTTDLCCSTLHMVLRYGSCRKCIHRSKRILPTEYRLILESSKRQRVSKQKCNWESNRQLLFPSPKPMSRFKVGKVWEDIALIKASEPAEVRVMS